MDRKVKKMSTANVAVAEVSILGIKKEFQAHSQIHSSDSLGSNVGDFSYSKTDRLLETYVDDEFPRFNDTEAKILEDIASQIKDPNTKGRIDLFTDLAACQSCTNLIMEFRRKYPNIELNVYSENMR
ncbi:deaminase domain-containing protein [Priestia koreensis]|uniref:deaminase domain-containing protein n=1 Tax=Priestia koreensis TaxID=284581 RepID=UPI00333F42F7